MKEFESSFSAIASGLRAFKGTTTPTLLECYNIKVMGEKGQDPYEPITQVDIDWIFEWPFPQVLFSNYYTLGIIKKRSIFGEDEIVLYEMVLDSEWETELITVLGYPEEILQSSLVDFGQFYVMSVFGYDRETGYEKIRNFIRLPSIEHPYVEVKEVKFDQDDTDFYEAPLFISGCNFNGQAVVGGISSNLPQWNERGLHSVCWGGIGNYEFDPEKDMTAGFADLDWGQNGQAVILNVRKLGNQVVVFSLNGLIALLPVSDPVSAFGKRNLFLPGIRSGNHVAGDDNICCWISVDNDLWMMDGKLGSKNLGYREWIEQLVSDDIRITYIAERKVFYFCDGLRCFCLYEGGFAECHQLVTSGGTHSTGVLGFFTDNADYEWRIETNEIDFKQKAFKTIQFIEAHSVSEQIQVKVLFKNTLTEDWKETSWKSVNPQGILYCPVSGSEFKIGIKGSDYRLSDGIVSDFKLRVKQTDKRNIRGMYSADKNFT